METIVPECQAWMLREPIKNMDNADEVITDVLGTMHGISGVSGQHLDLPFGVRCCSRDHR